MTWNSFCLGSDERRRGEFGPVGGMSDRHEALPTRFQRHFPRVGDTASSRAVWIPRASERKENRLPLPLEAYVKSKHATLGPGY